jgi:arylsulfatase A-like enzyme
MSRVAAIGLVGLAAIGAAAIVESLSIARGGIRNDGLRRSATVLFAVAAAAGLGFLLKPVFDGPRIARLSFAEALPYVAGATLVGGVAALERLRAARPIVGAGAYGVVAVLSLLADAFLHVGRYERVHDVAVAAAILSAARVGRGVFGAAAAPRVAIAVLSLSTAAGAYGAYRAATDVGFVADVFRAAPAAARVVAWSRLRPETEDPSVRSSDDALRKALALDATAAREHAEAVDPKAAERRPSLLMVAIDGMRSDYGPGSERGARIMPGLSALAKKGATFTRCYAPSPVSWPSIRSTTTGLYPDTFETAAADAAPPTIFGGAKERGYATAFLSEIRMLARGGAQWTPCFDRSLDVVKDGLSTEEAVFEVDGALASQKPFCIWMHPCDSHAPYRRDDPSRELPPALAYEASLSRVDRLIAPLCERVVASGGYVVLFGDHGEEFAFERGATFHGSTLYEQAIRVPLVFVGDGVAAGSFERPVSLVDLPPTALGLLGDARPPFSEGVSLLPALKGAVATGYAEREGVFSERRRFHWGDELPDPSRAWIGEGAKVIAAPSEGRIEAYDLLDDPGERRNLLSTDPPRGRALVDAYRNRVALRGAVYAARHFGASSRLAAPGPAEEAAVARDLESGDVATRRDAARVLLLSPRPDLHETLTRAAAGDADPTVRALASAALGKAAHEGDVWPATAALLGPSDVARDSALQSILLRPTPALGLDVARMTIANDGLHDWKPVAALLATGHRRGIELLRDAAAHETVDVENAIRCLPHAAVRPRPGTIAALATMRLRLRGRAAFDLAFVRTVSGLASPTALRWLREDAADADRREVAFEAERGVAAVEKALDVVRSALSADGPLPGLDWDRGPFPVAWGLVAGVDFVRPEDGELDPSEWLPPPPHIPVGVQRGAEAGFRTKIDDGATTIAIRFATLASGVAHFSIDDGETIETRFGPGVTVARLKIPEAATRRGELRVRWRVEGARPDEIGWREAFFPPRR